MPALGVRFLWTVTANYAGAQCRDAGLIGDRGIAARCEMALRVFAPARTARDSAGKLNAEIVRIVPDVHEKLAGMGVEPLRNSSEETAD